MKHSYAFFSLGPLLAAAALPAQAQSEPGTATHRPALLRLGVGSCLNGSGDYGVVKMHAEYAPQFGRHLRLGSRLAVISGSTTYDFGYGYVVPESYRAVNLEQEVYWVPFGVNKPVEFSVGVGAFGGYGSSKGLRYGGLRHNDYNGNPLAYPEFEYVSFHNRGFHAGYIASLNLDVAIDQARTWRVGGRLSLQNDTRATILPGGQFQISRAW
ncbi:hypothetical protein MTX78_13610 [Hymenobacter tibetensis]|uniref:Outer membrane protein beta-barrel domain-containing protein n=1 Tax=Hymenobacter tibetensis TaxID=497967 RepID=A0ABY4CSC5_9BACT|nr:hypothetical protein [Hymenobacter tibetensis]UOG73160.1 hypothetical protein MTX78_13610 [Hymenobacter tibetensis]